MLINTLQLGGSFSGGGSGGSGASAPNAPNDLGATATADGADMTWTAPPDNGSPITDYIIQYRETP